MAEAGWICVTLVASPGPRQTVEELLRLPAGARVSDALAASREALPALPAGTPPDVGLWGRAVALGHRLADQDRLELYRPLKVDPKVARRERFARQGARGTGLFAKRRPGAKPGY